MKKIRPNRVTGGSEVPAAGLSSVTISISVAAAPILLVLAASAVSRTLSFRWANVFKFHLTLLFGGIGLVGHLIRPEMMVSLIPPFFPLRMAWVYASGLIELTFAVLIWTRWAWIGGCRRSRFYVEVARPAGFEPTTCGCAAT